MTDFNDPNEQIVWLADAYRARQAVHTNAYVDRFVEVFTEAARMGADPDHDGPVPLVMNEDEFWWWVQDMRLLAEDPDLFFIEDDGPMSVANRPFPAAVIVGWGFDAVIPADALRESRDEVRRIARALRGMK